MWEFLVIYILVLFIYNSVMVIGINRASLDIWDSSRGKHVYNIKVILLVIVTLEIGKWVLNVIKCKRRICIKKQIIETVNIENWSGRIISHPYLLSFPSDKGISIVLTAARSEVYNIKALKLSDASAAFASRVTCYGNPGN